MSHSFIIGPKYYIEILKSQRVFDRIKGELENAKGREHKSIFNLKWLFKTLSN